VDNTQQKKTEDAPEMFVKQNEFWFLMVALLFFGKHSVYV
jgi:hypothetical protein